MAQFDPFAEYTLEQAAEIMHVSEPFLLGLLATAIKNGIVTARPGYKVLGSSISRLGKVYASKIETEHHWLAYLRVKERDDAELRERGILPREGAA